MPIHLVESAFSEFAFDLFNFFEMLRNLYVIWNMVNFVARKSHFPQAKFHNCGIPQASRLRVLVGNGLQESRQNLVLSFDGVCSMERPEASTCAFLWNYFPKQSRARFLPQNVGHKHISQRVWRRILSDQLIDIIGSDILLFPSRNSLWNLGWFIAPWSVDGVVISCSQGASRVKLTKITIPQVPTGWTQLCVHIKVRARVIDQFYFGLKEFLLSDYSFSSFGLPLLSYSIGCAESEPF